MMCVCVGGGVEGGGGERARRGGGGHSGTERLPTAKRPRRAEALNVKIDLLI